MTYAVFGLAVRSAIALPELFESAAAEADVTIRLGRVEDTEGAPDGLSVHRGGALLKIPHVGRYWIEGGREIVVEPMAGASDRNVRLFLLGSAFGAILHQRGLLPLHANAVEVDGRAIAFMGHPGAGKSTMAAWFMDRGHRVLADDVCVVTFDGSGRPVAHAGIPRLRLWREALEASGRAAGDYEASFDDMDKYNVPTPPASAAAALPLDHLYLLAKAQEDAGARIERLSGVAAVDALVANTYRGAYVRLMDTAGRHLAQCLKLVRSVPVFSAQRCWGHDIFEQEARAIEAHARAVIASASCG